MYAHQSTRGKKKQNKNKITEIKQVMKNWAQDHMEMPKNKKTKTQKNKNKINLLDLTAYTYLLQYTDPFSL